MSLSMKLIVLILALSQALSSQEKVCVDNHEIILDEVRELRAHLRTFLTLANRQRVQLEKVRLQREAMQQLQRRSAEKQDRLDETTRDTARMTANIKQIESEIAANPAFRSDLERQLLVATESLKAYEADCRELRAALQMLDMSIKKEQDTLDALLQALDELEKQLGRL